jgi:hypothetical protein
VCFWGHLSFYRIGDPLKTKLTTLFTAILCTTLLLSTSSTAWAKGPQPSAPQPFSEISSWKAVSEISGAAFDPHLDTTTDSYSNRLLALDDWSQCWILNNQTWVIDYFSTIYLGAKINMSIQCGTTDTQGYFHIAVGSSGHQQGWRNRITQARPGDSTDSWDDLMWWAAIQSWNAPELSVNQGNGKVCRSTPVQMYGYDSRGQLALKYTFRPSFVWSVTQNRLITAIPSTTPSC